MPFLRIAEKVGVIKIMQKRLFAVVLALVMVLSVTACAGEKTEFSLDDCAAMLLDSIPEPAYGSVGGEWAVLGLARWGGEVPALWCRGASNKIRIWLLGLYRGLQIRLWQRHLRANHLPCQCKTSA